MLKRYTRRLLPLIKITRSTVSLTGNTGNIYEKILQARRDSITRSPLFSINEYTQAVGYLVEKQYEKSEPLLRETLEKVFEKGLDQPSILSEVFIRQAICYMELGMNRELENSLQEILLITISDPNGSPESLFQAYYNILTFYIRENARDGLWLNQFFRDSKAQHSLIPQIYLQELSMMFALLNDIAGDHKAAESIYRDTTTYGLRSPAKGMLMNNYGVFVTNISKSIKSKTELQEHVQQAENLFKSSILEFEGKCC